MTSEKPPVVTPPFGRSDEGLADERTVVGVVLAAGTSNRFGDANKLITDWKGTPIVTRAIEAVSQSVVTCTVVVVGHDASRVQSAVADLDVDTVYNDEYAAGQATSVQQGVRAARKRDADAVLFGLGDMPAVSVESVDRVIAAYHAGVSDTIAAACDGTRGNPVLFGARHFPALDDGSGDVGGRDILLGDDETVLVETGDRGVLTDVDRPEDVAKLEE